MFVPCDTSNFILTDKDNWSEIICYRFLSSWRDNEPISVELFWALFECKCSHDSIQRQLLAEQDISYFTILELQLVKNCTDEVSFLSDLTPDFVTNDLSDTVKNYKAGLQAYSVW